MIQYKSNIEKREEKPLILLYFTFQTNINIQQA